MQLIIDWLTYNQPRSTVKHFSVLHTMTDPCVFKRKQEVRAVENDTNVLVLEVGSLQDAVDYKYPAAFPWMRSHKHKCRIVFCLQQYGASR